MALIKCPNCGKEFSEHASACPQCGIKMEDALSLIKKNEEEQRLKLEKEAAERAAKEAEEASIRAEKRAAWWAANKKKVWIIIFVVAIIGLVVASVIVTLSIVDKKLDKIQPKEEIENKNSNDAVTNIQSVLTSLSTNCSKGGNPDVLSNLFAETVSPYVSEGNTQYSRDIPEMMRKFLAKYDRYTMSSPTELNVQSQGSGYVATYNTIVEWDSERTGHKKACIQKTTYFNSEFKITGFTDKELWRESVTNNNSY